MFVGSHNRNGYKRLYKSGKYWVAAGVAAIGLSLPLLATSQTRAAESAPSTTTSQTTDATAPAKTVVLLDSVAASDVKGNAAGVDESTTETKGADAGNAGTETKPDTATPVTTPKQDTTSTDADGSTPEKVAGQTTTTTSTNPQEGTGKQALTKTMVDAVAAPADPVPETQNVKVSFTGLGNEDQIPGLPTETGSFTIAVPDGTTISVDNHGKSISANDINDGNALEQNLANKLLTLPGYYVESINLDGTTTTFNGNTVPDVTLTADPKNPKDHTLVYNMKLATVTLTTTYTDTNHKTLAPTTSVDVSRGSVYAPLQTQFGKGASGLLSDQSSMESTYNDYSVKVADLLDGSATLPYLGNDAGSIPTILRVLRIGGSYEQWKQMVDALRTVAPAAFQYDSAQLSIIKAAYDTLAPQLAKADSITPGLIKYDSSDATFSPDLAQTDALVHYDLMQGEAALVGSPIFSEPYVINFGKKDVAVTVNQVYVAPKPDEGGTGTGTTGLPGGNPTGTDVPTGNPETTPTGTTTVPNETPTTTPTTDDNLPSTGGTSTDDNQPGANGAETNNGLPASGGTQTTDKTRTTPTTPEKLAARTATATQKANELPQTGDSNHAMLAAIGMALAGAMALLSYGVVRRRQH